MGPTQSIANPVIKKIFSEEVILKYEACAKCMNDPGKAEEARKYERDIIKQITKYLVSHPSLPMPSFKFDLDNEIYQKADSESNDEKSFLTKITGIALNEPNTKECFESIVEKIQEAVGTGLDYRLYYFGFAVIALDYILNQDAIIKLKSYVEKVMTLFKQKIELEELKYALDDLKTKISAIQDILPMNNLKGLSKDEKKEVILSLFFPCEEIFQKITIDGGVYQTFAFYTFEIVVLFFIVELGVLAVAINEFEIDVHDKLKQRCSQYPLILEKYLKLMADQRPKLMIEKVLNRDALRDSLTGEYLYLSSNPYGLLAAFMKSDDSFYYAYKEKFQGNIAFFQKAKSELLENENNS